MGHQPAVTANGSGGSGVPSGDGAITIALLDEQIARFADLEALAAEQSAAIRSGDTDTLLRVLARRQALIEHVTQLSVRVRPLLGSSFDMPGVRCDAERGRIRERLASLDQVIARIAERDDRDRAELEQRRGEVAGQLGSMASGRRAVNAYGGKPTNGARFQDRRG